MQNAGFRFSTSQRMAFIDVSVVYLRQLDLKSVSFIFPCPYVLQQYLWFVNIYSTKGVVEGKTYCTKRVTSIHVRALNLVPGIYYAAAAVGGLLRFKDFLVARTGRS